MFIRRETKNKEICGLNSNYRCLVESPKRYLTEKPNDVKE
jgi:hypothetical protein